jgi:DNA (cytosine-5)-methyltransferase 1
MDGDANRMGYQRWRPARDIIDWSIPGESIFNRKKPLADNTLKRIASGIKKYWKDYADPFLAVLYGTGDVPVLYGTGDVPLLYGTGDVRSLDRPFPTITTSGKHHALVTPVPLFMGHESGQMSKSIDQPIDTILAQGRKHLIEPFITRYQGNHNGRQDGESRNHVIERPLPCRTITTKDRFAFIQPGMYLDIMFRMLKNHELKRAHSFPDDYILKGNATEQTKQIGNSNPVRLSKALAKSAINYNKVV